MMLIGFAIRIPFKLSLTNQQIRLGRQRRYLSQTNQLIIGNIYEEYLDDILVDLPRRFTDSFLVADLLAHLWGFSFFVEIFSKAIWR